MRFWFLIVLALSCVLSCRRGDSPPSPGAASLSVNPHFVTPPENSAKGSPPPEKPSRASLPLAWSRLPLLPAGLEPPRWSEALRAWNTATVAYQRGELEIASGRFLFVAETLKTDAAGPEGRVSSAGRCLAYENAARALRAAGELREALSMLLAAKDDDQGCKHSLSLRISRLRRLTATSASVRRAGP